MPLTPGTRLGPYEVVAPLGAGGMGEVYRARDTRLGRDVAIKVLPQHLSANPEVRGRFEREAKTVSSLNHPNICTLFDVGREGDTDYLVMELVDGETLAQRLSRGALPPGDVLRLGAQIADALDRAHRAGVVHRDLKPGNVMLTKSGAKLMDFGLARATAAAGPVSGSGATLSALTQSPTMVSPLTAEGAIVGTFQYMSPEQLEGRESDARADIWALGCVLYEMATGKRAFDGASQASLISAIMKEEPRSLIESVSEASAGLAAAQLDRLVRQCLAKDAVQRLQSAHDLKLQLEWIAGAGSQSSTAGPTVARRRRERMLWASAVVLVAAASIGALSMQRSATRPLSLEASVLPPADGEFSSSFSNPLPLAISPDGTTLVFCARKGEGADRLWVRTLASAQVRELAGTEGASSPFFSPDGRSVGFFARSKLMRVDVAGGPVIALADTPDPRGGSWGRNGVIVFAPDASTPIYRISADGGAATAVTAMDTTLDETTHRYPAFLPDGERFLYLTRRSGAGAGREPTIFAGSLKSLERKRVLAGASNVAVASGHLLFVRGGILMAQPFDAERLATSGSAVPLVEDLRWDERFSRGVFAVSRNGLLGYMSGRARTNTQLAWLDRAGNLVGRIGEPTSYTFGGQPEISADGGLAAVAVLNEEQGRSDVFVVDLATGRKRRLTMDESDHSQVTWLSGNQLIALDHDKGSAHVVRTLGGAIQDTLLSRRGWHWPLDASPDGRYYITWCSDIGVSDGLFAIPVQGAHEPIPITGAAGLPGSGQFSPDGRFVAFQATESGRSEVFVVPFPSTGQRWQVSQAGGVEPRWNPNGRELFFFDPENHLMAAEVSTSTSSLGFQVGDIRALFQFHGSGGTPRYDVSADGSRFLVTMPPAGPGDPPVTIVSDWTSKLRKR